MSFDTFVKNIFILKSLYGEECKATMLSSNFGVNARETVNKLEYLTTQKIHWSVEMHVDNPWEKYIDLFPAASVDKVSIGLESASKKTLLRMNKSVDPDKYLERAKTLLKKLAELHIQTTVNILIDFREDADSISDTLQFLYNNKKYISKVRMNHMFLFHGIVENYYGVELSDYIHQSAYNDKLHVAPIIPRHTNIYDLTDFINRFEREYSNT